LITFELLLVVKVLKNIVLTENVQLIVVGPLVSGIPWFLLLVCL